MVVTNGSHKLWVVDKNGAANNVFTLVDDVYADGPTLSAPADAFVGAVNPVTGRAADVIFTWPRLSKSTAYGLEISYDDGFKEDVTTVTVTSSGSTVVQAVGPYQASGTAQQVELQPGTTYYWRVRTTSPIKSPYSETRSFTVASIDKPFSISGPVAGASNVGISPLMTWDEYPGATGYELALSEDPSFAIVEWVRNVANNFYSVPEELNYSTTYYWRVRAVTGAGAADRGPWVTGVFQTEEEPAATGTPVVTIPAPPAATVVVTQPGEVKIVEVPTQTTVPQAIPDYLLWLIIIIGAVLVIALIVLIVRTRRVA
jgi:hypothetical protein